MRFLYSLIAASSWGKSVMRLSKYFCWPLFMLNRLAFSELPRASCKQSGEAKMRPGETGAIHNSKNIPSSSGWVQNAAFTRGYPRKECKPCSVLIHSRAECSSHSTVCHLPSEAQSCVVWNSSRRRIWNDNGVKLLVQIWSRLQL